MRKIVILGSIFIVIGIIIFTLPNNRYHEKEIITNVSENRQPDGDTGISMMYETEAGSGEYVQSEESNWLGEGYTFNSKLSSCENGGTLTWDDANKTVKLSTNKSDKCYVYFDAKEILVEKVLTDYIKSLSTVDGNGIYYHNGDLKNGLNDNSYRYSGANYKLTSKALENYDNVDNISDDANGIIKAVCNGNESSTYACNINYPYYFYLAYNPGIHFDTYIEAAEQALLDGYIVESIKNYVCFGSDATTCPYENLYRIVGIFDDKVKLIKADYATPDQLGTAGAYSGSSNHYSFYRGKQSQKYIYYWDRADRNSANNIWGHSLLNTVNLNGTSGTSFITSFSDSWQNKIATTTWQIGGVSNKQISGITIQEFFSYELGVNKLNNGDKYNCLNSSNQLLENGCVANNVTYNSKVGLMYASDFYFGADPIYWTYLVSSTTENDYRKTEGFNWMILESDWTLTRYYLDTKSVFVSSGTSSLSFNGYPHNSNSIRPVFYLTADTTFKGGTGESSNPYRIQT